MHGVHAYSSYRGEHVGTCSAVRTERTQLTSYYSTHTHAKHQSACYTYYCTDTRVIESIQSDTAQVSQFRYRYDGYCTCKELIFADFLENNYRRQSYYFTITVQQVPAIFSSHRATQTGAVRTDSCTDFGHDTDFFFFPYGFSYGFVTFIRIFTFEAGSQLSGAGLLCFGADTGFYSAEIRTYLL